MELLELIEKYWQVLSAIVLIIYSFAHLKAQNNEQEKRIIKLESEIDKVNPVMFEIRERLASIEATLKMLTK